MFHFYVPFHYKIPVYVGAKRALVVEYEGKERTFHGEDGFGDTKFGHFPDLEKIQKHEAACMALLR